MCFKFLIYIIWFPCNKDNGLFGQRERKREKKITKTKTKKNNFFFTKLIKQRTGDYQ